MAGQSNYELRITHTHHSSYFRVALSSGESCPANYDEIRVTYLMHAIKYLPGPGFGDSHSLWDAIKTMGERTLGPASPTFHPHFPHFCVFIQWLMCVGCVGVAFEHLLKALPGFLIASPPRLPPTHLDYAATNSCGRKNRVMLFLKYIVCLGINRSSRLLGS